MAKRYSRRRVLEGGLKGSALALSATSSLWTRSVESVWAEVVQKDRPAEESVLSSDQRAGLSAVANEIIPEGDGMPAASDVGAVDYMEVVLRDVPELRKDVVTALERLSQSSESMFQTDLSQLSSDQLVVLLKAFEAESQQSAQGQKAGQFQAALDLFGTLRDLVYEAYYTSPQVWGRLGYTFYETADGPKMGAFDEGILSEVRQRPRHYREVP